jgi:Holliday junction resolvasome RuvABC endonuclease subunit
MDFPIQNMCLGIDPGTVNMGLAIIHQYLYPFAELFQIKMERLPDAVDRIRNIQYLLDDYIHTFSFKPLAVIEGSSFGNAYRQVELAEIRASMVLWCLNKGMEVSIIPPQSIKKKVFGSAKIKAHEEWKDLENYKDAAAALSCAYACAKI